MRPVTTGASLVGVALLIVFHGFEHGRVPSWLPELVIGCGLTLTWLDHRDRRRSDGIRRPIEVALLSSTSLALAVAVVLRTLSRGSAELDAVAHVGFALVLGVNLARAAHCRHVERWHLRPVTLFVLSYAVLVSLGACVLMLPRMSATPGPMAPADALFTSVSASCVTGLIVLDTATALSRVGQVAVLGMIQLGGLNIICFASYFLLIREGACPRRDGRALREFIHAEIDDDLRGVFRRTLAVSLGVELVGALALALVTPAPARDWFSAGFHAVSAHNNAGFALLSDNLAGPLPPGYRAIVAGLIIAGGLGVSTLTSSWAWLRRGQRLSLDARVALLGTGALLAVGTLALLLTEAELGIADAAFQSTSARTAGFSSVEIGTLSGASLGVLMLLMFVGTASGSTGGGVKLSTIAVVGAGAWARVRGRPLALFRQPLDESLRWQSLLIVSLSLSLIALSTAALRVASPRAETSAVMFEVVSAFGTVGLSTGTTDSLSAAGRWIIIVTMLLGRIGPLALALSLAPPARPDGPRQLALG